MKDGAVLFYDTMLEWCEKMAADKDNSKKASEEKYKTN